MKTAAQKESRHCCNGRVCVCVCPAKCDRTPSVCSACLGRRLGHSAGLRVKFYRYRIRGFPACLFSLCHPLISIPVQHCWIFPLECSFPAGSIQTARLTVLTHTRLTHPLNDALCALWAETRKRRPWTWFQLCILVTSVLMQWRAPSFRSRPKWLRPHFEQGNADDFSFKKSFNFDDGDRQCTCRTELGFWPRFCRSRSSVDLLPLHSQQRLLTHNLQVTGT